MELNEFHAILGQTIMFCQTIEHDIKLIYSAMLNGSLSKNLETVSRWSLGATLKQLKKLDFSDKFHYISNSDYKFLMQITEKRNYWCHSAYTNFIYEKDFLNSLAYKNECQKLAQDNAQLMNVGKVIENVRISAMKDFDRV